MSYGAFVQACIDERRAAVLRGHSWEASAIKFASDHLPDFPEHRVLEVLRVLRWPDRRVSVDQALRAVRRVTSPAELRAWSDEMDSWQPIGREALRAKWVAVAAEVFPDEPEDLVLMAVSALHCRGVEPTVATVRAELSLEEAA